MLGCVSEIIDERYALSKQSLHLRGERTEKPPHLPISRILGPKVCDFSGVRAMLVQSMHAPPI